MSIETLQRRIKTTQDLRDIVSTMKSLSSVSILQYEQAGVALEQYLKNILAAFHALIKTDCFSPPPARPKPQNTKTLAIVIGSDNGLVGKFNKEIINKAAEIIEADGENLKDSLFITIGKRVAVMAEQKEAPLFAKYAISNSIKVVNSIAGTVIIRIEEAMRIHKVNRVLVFYHKRETGQPTRIEQVKLIPFPEKAYANLKNKPWPTNNIPMVTIPAKEMFSTLIREYLMILLSSALTFSLAAEHHARMINMQNAEKNIDESLEQMNQEYQQKRQEAITEELIDVVSGSEAITIQKPKIKEKTFYKKY